MDEMTLGFADGETFSFPALEGESVLAAAERAGHLLASNCRKGTCRSCAAHVEGREVLLCQEPSRPGFRADLSYRRADIAPWAVRRAKINAITRVSRSVFEVRYRLQQPLPFRPGQYVEVSFEGLDGSRSFSMANPPSQPEQVLHVRETPTSQVAAYLRERAKVGELFKVRGPFGVFYLRQTAGPKLFVAGGTGLAPILSMLRTLAESGLAGPYALVFGMPHPDDAYALDEIEALKRALPLEVVTAAMEGAPGFAGHVGTAVSALDAVASLPVAAGTEAYVCGPPGMVIAARAALEARGIPAAGILNEEFAPRTA